ncbi:MAG: hypothetical protein JSS00_06360 [Proteobacteria bacterium]|nr:hypothetical protein [Pseudomonadota bacterium]
MRRMVLSAAALLVCACGQQAQIASGPAATGCARSATHQIAWTDADVPDTIITRAEGPSCLQAVVTLVARDAHGDPLWTFISTYHAMTTGGAAPAAVGAASPQQVDRFLASWADVTTTTSDRLPEWREGAANVGSNGGLAYTTTFSRESYEGMRQRNLRMICYAAAVDTTQCLVVDPSSNAPAMIVAYGP